MKLLNSLSAVEQLVRGIRIPVCGKTSVSKVNLAPQLLEENSCW